MKQFLKIPNFMLKDIIKQAEQEYPHECCGMVFASKKSGAFTRVKNFKNCQDDRAGSYLKSCTRTSKEAYFMAPEDLIASQKESRKKADEIRIIYHSHIDTPADFSGEDKRMAVKSDQPVFRNVQYLVLSVRRGVVKSHALFKWNDRKKNYYS